VDERSITRLIFSEARPSCWGLQGSVAEVITPPKDIQKEVPGATKTGWSWDFCCSTTLALS